MPSSQAVTVHRSRSARKTLAASPANVAISGADTSKTYRCHYVTDKKCDRIYPGGTYDLGKTKTVSLRPKSIMVLTTYTYGTQTVR